jgi:poly(A) polymerase
MVPDRFAPVLAELAPLAKRFADAGHRLYLVGGTVRDLMVDSGRSDYDLDLTTDARPPDIKACLAGWADAVWTQGERFGTIGAKFGQRTYEITTFRAESYADDSRKPHVTYADDVETDLGRRDFTVNAMALELTGGETPTLVDPHGGALDLINKVLRTAPTSASATIRCGCSGLRVSSPGTACSRPNSWWSPSTTWRRDWKSCRPNGSAMSSTN